MRCALLTVFFAGLMVAPVAAQSSEEPTSEDESVVEGDLRIPAIFRDVPRPRSDDLRVPDIFRDAPRPASSDLRVPDIFRSQGRTTETAQPRRRPRPALSDLRIPDIFRHPAPVRLGVRLADPSIETDAPPMERPGLGRDLARP